VTSDFLRAPLHVLPDDSGCVIDCDTCTVRGAACDDCVVSVMLGGPPAALPADPAPLPGADPAPARGPGPAPPRGAGNVIAVDPEARRALAVLAEAGVVPPLRMTRPAVPPTPGPT
jgi:hypothetical protein